MSHPVSFFHIGLPKCGSTFLQALWANDPQYQTLRLDGAVNGARTHAKNGNDYLTNFPVLNLNLDNVPKGYIIGSSEGFTWAYVNDPENHQFIPYLHKVSSKLLGETKITDSILIVVRDPIRWIRSAHEQTIKEGNFLDMQGFIKTHRQFIENVLNLRLILESWKKYFNNIVILPLEWLNHNEEKFWSIYEKKLNVRAPGKQVRNLVSNKEKTSRNASMGLRLPALAMLNKRFQDSWSIYNNLTVYKNLFSQEYEYISSNYIKINTFLNRRIAEHATEEEFNTLTSMNTCPSVEEFQAINIDNEMFNSIENNYINIIEEFDYIDKEIIEGYRHSLKENMQD